VSPTRDANPTEEPPFGVDSSAPRGALSVQGEAPVGPGVDPARDSSDTTTQDAGMWARGPPTPPPQ
jgi:hypothetical protein